MYKQKYDMSIISIHSKNVGQQSSKGSPSTETPQSPLLNYMAPSSFNSRQDMWSLQLQEEQKNGLRLKIGRLQRQQQQMQQKYKKWIQKIMIQIDRNSQYNNYLSNEVNNMKTELQQSKKDILLIEEYMKNHLSRREVKTGIKVPEQRVLKLKTQINYNQHQSKSRYSLTRRTPLKLFGSKLNGKI